MYLLLDQSDCRIVEFEPEWCRIMPQGLNEKFFQVDGQTVLPYLLLDASKYILFDQHFLPFMVFIQSDYVCYYYVIASILRDFDNVT